MKKGEKKNTKQVYAKKCTKRKRINKMMRSTKKVEKKLNIKKKTKNENTMHETQRKSGNGNKKIRDDNYASL